MFETYLTNGSWGRKRVCLFICRGKDKANKVTILTFGESRLKSTKLFSLSLFHLFCRFENFQNKFGGNKRHRNVIIY